MEKMAAALRNSDFTAVLVTGSDNIRYLSGATLPFFYGTGEHLPILYWPKRGNPELFCSSEAEESLRADSWIGRVVGVDCTRGRNRIAVPPIKDRLREGLGSRRTRRIGIDMDRVSPLLFQKLREDVDGIEWVDCSRWVIELRMQKTAREIAVLKEVAYRTDHAILAAAHHVLSTVPRPEKGLSEIIRVHSLERELDAIGYHSIAQGASGIHTQYFWPLAPKFGVGGGKALQPGEFVRMELNTALHGYWATAARMLTMGEPSLEQRRTFAALTDLKNAMLQKIEPGVPCNRLFQIAKDMAPKLGVEFIRELPAGHGIGVSVHEHPYLNEVDTTGLRAGMVLVLDPVIRGADRGIIRSKDTVSVTDSGYEVIGWYKDWREPYIALDSYPHGGG